MGFWMGLERSEDHASKIEKLLRKLVGKDVNFVSQQGKITF